MSNLTLNTKNDWSAVQKAAFRFFFIYFVVQAIPLDWKWYRDLFSINWSNFSFADFFELSRYQPRFLLEVASYADWGIVALIALAGTVVWSAIDRKSERYDTLYYYLRVVVRYRLAVGVIAYGFIKLFPIQAPYPSLSALNTHYGDIDAWKLFSLSLGIVPDFQSFLGFVELLAGGLLLYRKTAAVGAFILVAYTGNVVLSNLAYEGGEYVYSFYLVIMALFILAYDAPRLISLLTLERPTSPNRFRLSLDDRGKKVRLVLKGAFILLAVGYGIGVYNSSITRHPSTPGLANAEGLYNVEQFVINQDTIPYSVVDSVRWRDVVFEKWNTLSIRSNKPVRIAKNNVEYIAVSDNDRLYEAEGLGDRHYYSYTIDEQNTALSLVNRNRNHEVDFLELRYIRPDSATLILYGKTSDNNLIHVTLRKLDKKYLLEEARKAGRRNGLKL